MTYLGRTSYLLAYDKLPNLIKLHDVLPREAALMKQKKMPNASLIHKPNDKNGKEWSASDNTY